MKIITIKVDELTGEIKFETSGFHGKTCYEASKAIEEAFGKKTKTRPKDTRPRERHGN